MDGYTEEQVSTIKSRQTLLNRIRNLSSRVREVTSDMEAIHKDLGEFVYLKRIMYIIYQKDEDERNSRELKMNYEPTTIEPPIPPPPIFKNPGNVHEDLPVPKTRKPGVAYRAIKHNDRKTEAKAQTAAPTLSKVT